MAEKAQSDFKENLLSEAMLIIPLVEYFRSPETAPASGSRKHFPVEMGGEESNAVNQIASTDDLKKTVSNGRG